MPTSIICNKNDKNYFIYSAGRSLTLYSINESKIIREINNYTYGISATTIRKDGLVMVTGDEEGRVEVKDTKEKFNLRVFDQCKKRIGCLEYYGQDLYAAGDDLVIRLYDVAAG
jgi:WD40 repeat protein